MAVRRRLQLEGLESRHLPSTFFVADPQFGGNDGNAGTDPQQPWATVGQVNAAFAAGQIAPGDTICFHRGDGFAGNLADLAVGGAAGSPITIKDYGDDPRAPTLNAGDGTGILVQDAGNVEIANLEIVGSYDPVTHPSSNGNGIEFLNTTGHLLTNISIHDVTIHGFGNGGTSAFVPDSGCGILIDVRFPPEAGFAYDTISVSRCDVFNNVRAGVETFDSRYAVQKPFLPSIAHVRIDHVDAHDSVPPVGLSDLHAGNGILLIGVEDGVVERSRAFNNGTRLTNAVGLGIWTYHSDHILFQFNEAFGNRTQPGGDEGGFDFDPWTTNSIMQYNYSHDNDGYGYMIGSVAVRTPISEHNVIRFNISENDCRNTGYGALLFESWAASDIDVYNNTFYMTDNGLDDRTYHVAPAIRFSANDPTNAPQAAPTIHLYNNIFFTTSVSPTATVPVVLVDSYFPVANVTFRANDYFSNGPAAFQIVWPVSPGVQSVFTSVTAWGLDAAAVSVDPALGFEGVLGSNNLPLAPTIQQIDSMATELVPYFNLTGSSPAEIQSGGTDLAMAIAANWWAPDAYWGTLFGAPYDFFGANLPSQVGGAFSIGASVYPGG